MNILRKIITLLYLIVFISACSVKDVIIPEEQSTTSDFAIILNNSKNAIKGELVIKFDENMTDNLDKVVTKSNNISRINNLQFDAIVEHVANFKMNRVFPIDYSKEDITRKSKLHLWYKLTFSEDTDIEELAKSLAQVQGINRIQYIKPIAVNIDDRQFVTTRSSFVTKARVKNSHTPFNDPDFDLQWHLKNNGNLMEDKFIAGADVNAVKAWERCTGDSSIIVAVLDHGVYYNHPDLHANMWVNKGEEIGAGRDSDNNGYKDDKHGYNFRDDKGVLGNCGKGHGTHVAGLVSAVNNNGVGIASVAGGSGKGDGVRIMSCQLFEENYAPASVVEEAKAMKYAADNGAVIMQCSWGSATTAYESDEKWMSILSIEKEGLDYFIHNAGSPSGVIDGGIVIFASGNDGKPEICYPARYKDYIAVAAITADYTPSIFTNFAEDVDVASPGGDIIYHSHNALGGIYSTLPLDHEPLGYGGQDGTSMATPIVSSVAALGLSYAAQLKKHFKAEEFKQMIMSSTRNIESYYTGTKDYYIISSQNGNRFERQKDISGYKGKMGSGIIDAVLMLDAVERSGRPMKIPNVTMKDDTSKMLDLAYYFVNGSSKSFSVNIADTAIADATLNGTILTIKAKKIGTTSIKIKAEGVDQNISLIVVDAVNNGWL